MPEQNSVFLFCRTTSRCNYDLYGKYNKLLGANFIITEIIVIIQKNLMGGKFCDKKFVMKNVRKNNGNTAPSMNSLFHIFLLLITFFIAWIENVITSVKSGTTGKQRKQRCNNFSCAATKLMQLVVPNWFIGNSDFKSADFDRQFWSDSDFNDEIVSTIAI